MPVALEYYADHFLVRMVGPAALTSLKRAIVVPYSDVAAAQAKAPEWPAIFSNRVGLHAPKFAVSGLFMDWRFQHHRFLHFDRNTSTALWLDLNGHPDYEQVVIAVRDAEAAAAEIMRRRDDGSK